MAVTNASTDPKLIRVSRVIAATPQEIFAVLSDPARHREIDGSAMVGSAVQPASGTPQQLTLGSKFSMNMKLGPLPYRMTNEVVEFEPNRLIAWQHIGHHRWRYRLEPIDSGTRVTEEFDWRTARSGWIISLAGYQRRHPGNMTRTLERLAAIVEPS